MTTTLQSQNGQPTVSGPAVRCDDWLSVRRIHIDLFSGLAGFALAAQANNVETKIFCEQNEACCDFLTRTWGLPIIRDVRKFDGTRWHGVWLLTAGVPCQPASRAGEQRGEDDDRWLWPEALRVTEESEPTWALFENPAGILDVGLDGILSELGRLGYESQPISIPAAAVNSPQDRERIWILANRTEPRSQRSHAELPQWATRRATERAESPLADAEGVTIRAGLRTGNQDNQERTNSGRRRLGDVLGSWSDFQWIACENGKLRRFPNQLHSLGDGIPARILEALGNAIVWPVAAEIIAAMIATETRTLNDQAER